jgi:hypothetical protein
MNLVHTRVHDGFWEALVAGVAGSDAPKLDVKLGDTVLTDIELTKVARPKGGWHLRVPLPQALVSDDGGLICVIDQASGNVIGMLQVHIGVPAEGNLALEVQRLRQELEVVKDVLRRHLRDKAN